MIGKSSFNIIFSNPYHKTYQDKIRLNCSNGYHDKEAIVEVVCGLPPDIGSDYDLVIGTGRNKGRPHTTRVYVILSILNANRQVIITEG